MIRDIPLEDLTFSGLLQRAFSCFEQGQDGFDINTSFLPKVVSSLPQNMRKFTYIAWI